jgi:AcrR family transcriptional regulator
MNDRILLGTLGVIGRRGVRGLSMREISESAGVSRGTIYRYYRTKEDVLAAATNYNQQRFLLGASEALDGIVDGDLKIHALVTFLQRFLAEHQGTGILQTEPGYVLKSLDAWLPDGTVVVADLLRETLQDRQLVRSGAVTVEDLADLLVRLMYSTFLVPGPDPGNAFKTIGALLT